MPSVRIWDLPVRVVHWSFVLLIALSWWSAESDLYLVHRISGYTMLAVLLFRLYWGFRGSDTARFRRFLRGRAAVLAYLDTLFEKDSVTYAGHNPLGGWSTVLILSVLLLQCGLGLASITVEGTEGGPLSRFLSFDAARDAAVIHERLFNVILLLAAVHIASIGFYWLVKKQNLVLPMLTGSKALAQPPEMPAQFRSARIAVAITLLGWLALIVGVELWR